MGAWVFGMSMSVVFETVMDRVLDLMCTRTNCKRRKKSLVVLKKKYFWIEFRKAQIDL